MQEKKEVLKARGLKASFNSFMNAYKNARQTVDDDHLGTRNIAKIIEPCVIKHAENPQFPVEELRENINCLREAVEDRNVHKVHTWREKIENLLSEWENVPAPIIIGS
ncbi:MAG TPA: hypothetical protein PLD14_03640 [Candidatus Pacearchaeota archaeon]|nr:hypothetical protein [Candidatus Pacearchaeota archaeon]HPR80283.1 hypothetical protein [Candidatus Pacearchaeota archaeon]